MSNFRVSRSNFLGPFPFGDWTVSTVANQSLVRNSLIFRGWSLEAWVRGGRVSTSNAFHFDSVFSRWDRMTEPFLEPMDTTGPARGDFRECWRLRRNLNEMSSSQMKLSIPSNIYSMINSDFHRFNRCMMGQCKSRRFMMLVVFFYSFSFVLETISRVYCLGLLGMNLRRSIKDVTALPRSPNPFFKKVSS